MKSIAEITRDIKQRSQQGREQFLQDVDTMASQTKAANRLSCSNWAHVVAANSAAEKQQMPAGQSANIGIVSAYNDMLSAHQPFATYPSIIKLVARELGATAQVAGGVPAMCDGVTQGQPGMELSLFSRDVIALATGVSLAHDVYDAVICLGVCDKIAPGMLIGALQFAHLPIIFAPAGPMPSGLSNKEKAVTRQKFASGEIAKSELLEAESAAYHSPGTCTFYGTANTNQVILEALGVQLAGTSFINPSTELRAGLTRESVARVLSLSKYGSTATTLADMVTEESLVNAIVMMTATGGSTNLTLHLIAIAKAAGITISWQDMDDISRITPLLARVYPNGEADVNQFEQAGGLAHVVRELRKKGLLNEEVKNVMGGGLDAYELKPELIDNKVSWNDHWQEYSDESIVRPVSKPFADDGGLKVVSGNLGTAVIKTSAVESRFHAISVPCKVFDSQQAFIEAFQRGDLECHHVSVLRYQGPIANGMPELHKLTPYLSVLQDKGFDVALLTDGRMSGASGKVLAAIHLSPEAAADGLIAYLQDGDKISINANTGKVNVELSESELRQRSPAQAPAEYRTLGRNLFSQLRAQASDATQGASFLW